MRWARRCSSVGPRTSHVPGNPLRTRRLSIVAGIVAVVILGAISPGHGKMPPPSQGPAVPPPSSTNAPAPSVSPPEPQPSPSASPASGTNSVTQTPYGLPASRLAWLLLASGALTLPVVSLAYLVLRLQARKAALVNFFTQDVIIERYLVMRGRRPPRAEGESDDAYRARLRLAFNTVFTGELRQQYSLRNFVLPMALAWFVAALTIFILVRSIFGPAFSVSLPSAMLYALFGAFVWSVWMIIRAYTRNDLTPSTFYWVFFRHLLALAYGGLAGQIFTPAYADLGAFFVGTLPFSQLIRFFGTRFGTLAGLTPTEGAPKLSDLQGMDSTVIQRLDEMDIHSAQDLAFSDPMELLLLSNFPVKVLVDWMDQAFLLNYVGEGIADLRVRGIRGAIEMASLHNAPEGDPRVESVATALKVTPSDVRNLASNLYLDNHLLLIWHLWGVFEQK